jgi:hypothetical protein
MTHAWLGVLSLLTGLLTGPFGGGLVIPNILSMAAARQESANNCTQFNIAHVSGGIEERALRSER